MAAPAAMSPSYHPVTTFPSRPWELVDTPRAEDYDYYMRENDPYCKGPLTHADHGSRPEQSGRYQPASPGHFSVSGYRSHEIDPLPAQYYRDRPSYAPVTRDRERGVYREHSRRYDAAPVYRERDGHRMNTPSHEAASTHRGRNEFDRDTGFHSTSRYDRSPSYDWQDNSRHPSTDNRRSEYPWPTREKRQPRRSRGGDLLTQPNNPNSIPILKRGAVAAEASSQSVRGRADIPPPRFAEINEISPSRQDDLLPLHAAPANRTLPNDSEKHAVEIESIRRIEAQNVTKPLPLFDLPPNIHPSRRAAISQAPPRKEGGARQMAKMRAPRKQLDSVAQSIEPAEKTMPAFLRLGDNANAVPLGPGKKIRF